MKIWFLNYNCKHCFTFKFCLKSTGYFYIYRLKSSNDVSDISNQIVKEKWIRPSKIKKQRVHENCESSVFHDTLIDKCWFDQQLPFMFLDVDLDVTSDDVELNIYPILRILENQRVRNQNEENLMESEKQEVNIFS